MTLRRLVGWGWIILFFSIGIFAFLANPIISFIYFALGVSFTAFHFVKYCAGCTNESCPLSTRSVDFIFGNLKKPPSAGYLDIKTAKSSWPIVFIMLFPLYFIWVWSPFVVIGLILFSILLLVAYLSNTCRFCANSSKNRRAA